MCDVFFIAEKYNIASYADDDTAYTGGQSIKNVMLNLEKYQKFIFCGFFLTY